MIKRCHQATPQDDAEAMTEARKEDESDLDDDDEYMEIDGQYRTTLLVDGDDHVEDEDDEDQDEDNNDEHLMDVEGYSPVVSGYGRTVRNPSQTGGIGARYRFQDNFDNLDYDEDEDEGGRWQ